MFSLLILASIVIMVIEGLPLKRKKMWRELTTVLFLIFLAIFFGVIKVLGLPTPINILKSYLYPLGIEMFKHE